MGRAPCCSKLGLMRGPWSTKEDTLLINYIQQHGEGKWRDLPKKAGLLRCGKSCRLRWMNYLRPGIKRGNIREEEEDLIVRLHGLLGNRWSLIAGRLPGRTDNEIKNYWNTHLLKKLTTAAVRHTDPPVETEKSVVGIAGKKKRSKKTNKDEKNAARRMDLAPPRTKVYLPKPIRISPVFSRSSSHDCLTSADTSSGGGGKAAEVASCVPVEVWPPLVEVEDAAVYGDGGGDDYIGGEYMLPVVHSVGSVPGDVEMLEKVYDEYLQLLSCRSIE